MKYEESKQGMTTVKVHEYDSLDEFYKYICDTPINEVFRWGELTSSTGGYSFTQTHSFDEATELFKHGWDAMAKDLEHKLQIATKEMEPTTKARSTFDVVGFQASVPRYLQGIPTSMVNKKQVPTKQKVVTITKSVSYSGGVDKDDIVRYSIAALTLVKKIEAKGYRVNLNIVLGTEADRERVIAKIRIKNAGERLNISKVAFPMVHPSMLRRLLFRFIEVSPSITKKGFKYGHGMPVNELNFKGEIYIPAKFELKDVDAILAQVK